MLLLALVAAALAGPPGIRVGPAPPRIVEEAPDADFLRESGRLAQLSPEETGWRAGDPEPYHLRAEILAETRALVERYPGRVTPQRVGRTSQGRSIWGYRVSDPGTPAQRKLLVFANIHAMEWISTEVALAFLQDVVERPPPGVEIMVIPVLNVDGRLRAEEDLVAGEDREYRRANARGVDLNRNFAVHTQPRAIWRKLIPGYYSMPPAPLSEPEAQAIDALGAEGWDAAVSLHAFGGFHYYPWTGLFERAPHWKQLHALGTAMQAGQGAGAYKPMQLSRWGFFFRGHGMEIDHLYGRYGIPSVLVELTRSGVERPKDIKTPFRWYNPRRPARHLRLGVGALHAVAWDMAWAVQTGELEPWSGVTAPLIEGPLVADPRP